MEELRRNLSQNLLSSTDKGYKLTVHADASSDLRKWHNTYRSPENYHYFNLLV